MRTEPRTWKFFDNAALTLISHVALSDSTSKIKGLGKIWNDKVKVGDIIQIKVKLKKTEQEVIIELKVDTIQFTSDSAYFEAECTLGELIS